MISAVLYSYKYSVHVPCRSHHLTTPQVLFNFTRVVLAHINVSASAFRPRSIFHRRDFHDPYLVSTQISLINVIHIMYYLPLVSSIVVLLLRLVLSFSIPIDDLESNALLYDDTQPSLFLAEDNEFLTTADEALLNPCAAAQDDLSFTQEGTNLFSREVGAQCLPPVNIGAETLQLFEESFDSLESIILPLKRETSDDPPPVGFPGRLPDGEKGDVDLKTLENLGWQPYTGPVGFEAPDNSNCEELTRHRGNFKLELCCNAMHVGYDTQNQYVRDIFAQIDAETIANQDFALVYNCIRTFVGFFFGLRQRFPFRSVNTNLRFIRQSPFLPRLVLTVIQYTVFVAIVM